MRRFLAVWFALVVLVSSPAGASATASTVPTPTDPPITLPEGKSLTECISSNPKPGCSTARRTDGHQVAVLGVMTAGLLFVGWRISRSIRRRDKAIAPADHPEVPAIRP